MGSLEEPFRLVIGRAPSRYYPAHVPIKDRTEPGLHVELGAGRPWRWIGCDGPVQGVGPRQTVWLWARTQAQDWIQGRPGLAWRSGLSDADIAASGRRLPGRPRRRGEHEDPAQ